MAQRHFIEISYKGTAYHGWQAQKNAVTVQSVLEYAIRKITGESVGLTGAGRTDTGVHASSFIAHFDSTSDKPDDRNKFIHSLNSVLPEDIAVKDVRQVKPDAHARYSAIERTYEYTIIKERDPFLNETAWLYRRDLNMTAMNQASSLLSNFDDFTSFSKLHSNNKTNTCRISEAKWFISGNKLIFRITADRFLRNMVRSIVGTLILVGSGKKDTDAFVEIILKKDRSSAGFSAPACGLSLVMIKYPLDIYV